MSGTGRAIADDILAEQQTRRRGHRNRWQARIEGKDGRTLAKSQRPKGREDADGLTELRQAGFRVR